MKTLLMMIVALCAAVTTPAQMRFPPGAIVDVTVYNGKAMFTVVVPVSPPDFVFVEFWPGDTSMRGWQPVFMHCHQVSTFDSRPCAIGAWLSLENRSPTRPWNHDSLWPRPLSPLHTFVPLVAMDLFTRGGDVSTQWRFAYCTAGWQCPPPPCSPPVPMMVGAIFEVTLSRGG